METSHHLGDLQLAIMRVLWSHGQATVSDVHETLEPERALAWLLTYLLHSTLLLGRAWLAAKPLARWSVAAEEAVWKLALVGALVTASLQLAAGWEPAAGRWSLAQAPAAELTMTNRTNRT